MTNTNEPTFKLDPSRRIFARYRNTSESDIITISVYAKNLKGRSQSVPITEYHIGNFKHTQKDLRQQSSHSSPFLLGIFFTIFIIALTIIARAYWKSKKKKRKEMVKEDKNNMESRCSLLKQDNFAVSKIDCVSTFFSNRTLFTYFFLLLAIRFLLLKNTVRCFLKPEIQADRYEYKNKRKSRNDR